MDPRDAMDPEQLETLNRAFSEQLLACLDACARGRRGLFSEFMSEDGEERPWSLLRLNVEKVVFPGASPLARACYCTLWEEWSRVAPKSWL